MSILTINKQKAHSIYRIYGDNEDTLTKAFGFVLAHNSTVAQSVLKIIGIKNIVGFDKKHGHDDFTISLQRHREKGITDIEIQYKNDFLAIIEAKINNNFPPDHQIINYLREMKHSNCERRILVILNENRVMAEQLLSNFKEKHGKQFLGIEMKTISWADIFETLESTKNQGFIVGQLKNFMEREYKMKNYFDQEVWVCPVSKIPNTNISTVDIALDQRIYFHPAARKVKTCLYFAPKHKKKIEHIFKINPPFIGLPEKEVKLSEKWSGASKPHAIFKLGTPIKLPNPVTYSGQRHTYCTIEDLFTKNSLDKK